MKENIILYFFSLFTGGGVSYKVIKGGEDRVFDIKARTGQLYLQFPLDYEVKNKVSIALYYFTSQL